MNDIILSGLINMFAIFGSLANIDREKATKVLAHYLGTYFGVRDIDNYIDMYNVLREMYDDDPNFDKDKVLSEICSKIKSKISIADQLLLLLRFMEFSKIDTSKDMAVFKTVAKDFEVDDSLFDDFCSFVNNQHTERVIPYEAAGIDGTFLVLNIVSINTLVFKYSGNDDVMYNDIPIQRDIFMIWQHSGIIKSKKSSPVYYSNVAAAFNKKQQENQFVFCGRDINFLFPNSNNGLHHFSFDLRSGQLIAIMGGSGVGKSTLLSILNGNIIPQEGNIWLNGHDISEEAVKKLIGFVPQDDLLIEELTVYQNLYYAASLCFDKISKEAIDKKILNILSDLDLLSAKDLKVGSALNKYISGGQRKRLNIALELIREPGVLFLDEPTSGLSSTDSEKVINLLKEQTYKGKLIVINIHQPSSDIYKLFDKIWILDKGGYPIYDGNPIEAITYFKQAANYADANVSTCALCGNINPEIILNIIDFKCLSESGHLTDKRKVTPEEWHRKYLDKRTENVVREKMDVPKSHQRKPGALKQFFIYLHRNIATKITDTQYLLIALLETPVLAAIIALLSRYAPEDGYSVMANKNLVSYFFMAVIVAIFTGMSISAEEIFKDRLLLKREKFLRLSYASYIWSKIVFVAIMSFIQTCLFILVGNAVIGIDDMFGTWLLILFFSSFLAGLTGLVISQTLNSIVSIYITIPLLLIPQILLCGMVVNFSDLCPNSKTNNVPLIGEIIPSRWAFEALSVSYFADNSYNRLFFDDEREKCRAQYYKYIFMDELESQLEHLQKEKEEGKAINISHFAILKQNIPTLASECGCPIPECLNQLNVSDYCMQTYADLHTFFTRADSMLYDISSEPAKRIDETAVAYIRQYGKEQLIDLKRDHFNTHLESLLLNSNSSRSFKIIDNVMIPQVAILYLEPFSHNGRAPFYSSVKIVGKIRIPTLIFNISILFMMCVLVSLCLFFKFPGRFLKREE